MKIYCLVHLETMEENRVDYPDVADMIDFKAFQNKDEAIEYFNNTVNDVKENYYNEEDTLTDEIKDFGEDNKKGILKNMYIQTYECTRQIYLIEKEI